jgi:hypothetical protein
MSPTRKRRDAGLELGSPLNWSQSDQVSLLPRPLPVTLLRRSAMRVCQPGPVARHRATTSAGRRKEMSCRGFAERGRPPLLTVARESISSVSSGSCSCSGREMRRASTRARSDFEVRCETGLLTMVGLAHAEGCGEPRRAPGSRQPLTMVVTGVLASSVTPANTSAASSKSSPRSASVLSCLSVS